MDQTSIYVCQAFPVRNRQGTNLRLLREKNLGLAARGILRKDLLRYRDLKDLGGKTDGENLMETHTNTNKGLGRKANKLSDEGFIRNTYWKKK